MNENLARCVHEAIARSYFENLERRQNLAIALPNWPTSNLIQAPLNMLDLYVTARRNFGTVTIAEIKEVIREYSAWEAKVIAPFGRGIYEYWLVLARQGQYALLRLGEHPNNGVMSLIDAPTKEIANRELARYFTGIEFNVEDPGVKYLTVSPAEFRDIVLDVLLQKINEEASFEVQEIAFALLKANPKIVEVDPELEINPFPSLVQSAITSVSHRVLVVSMYSILGDILAYDLIRLPSGELFLVEWPDEGDVRVLGQLESEHYALGFLKSRLLEFFDESYLAGPSMVILGKTLVSGEQYPVEDDSFWRDLLGFPYVLERP